MNAFQSIPLSLQTILLLVGSNIFMTFAWYGQRFAWWGQVFSSFAVLDQFHSPLRAGTREGGGYTAGNQKIVV